MTRRRFFEKVSIALGGFCAALLGVPLVGFVIAPLFRKAPNEWLSLGKVADFEIGRTVNVTITDPSSLPWAGISAKSAAWLRRVNEEQFIAFSAHCTHMGCPVRWLSDAELFMCPCHGGVFMETEPSRRVPRPSRSSALRCESRTARCKSKPARYRSQTHYEAARARSLAMD